MSTNLPDHKSLCYLREHIFDLLFHSYKRMPALLAGITISFILYHLIYDSAPEGVPRIGKAGGIGYPLAASQYTTKSEEVLNQADRMFGGQTYAIPTLAGWVIVLSDEHLETLRSSDDSILLQLDHTLDNISSMMTHASVVRNEVAKGIADFIPEILDESTLAMEETYKPPSGSGSLPIFHAMTHMVGRISNRTIMGTEMCRDEDFVHAVVTFAKTSTHEFLTGSPMSLAYDVIRLPNRLVCFILSSIWGGPKQAKAFNARLAKLTVIQDGIHALGDFTSVNLLQTTSIRLHYYVVDLILQMELTIMIAVILLNYEIKLPDGEVHGPKNMVIDGFILPPLKEHLLFKRGLRKV
ncbi:hypothetical protein BDN71DRAFT_1501184 [Pleurotus eryngii]|uniref:Uncharacterized protein n=1 Tax=Pleurotus eryngii TaxID=5323 RepID=A0A9P6A8C6_PLEER|nr:hypothetical protein BDN71DRAFT_1501184 [Pleurotus eryngii]